MIGRRLKLARVAAGLSLDDLETKFCGSMNAQAIGKFERDLSMPDSGVLIALAAALGVSADYLIGCERMAFYPVMSRENKFSASRKKLGSNLRLCT